MQYGTSKYNSQKGVKFDEKVGPLVKLYDAVYNLNGTWVQSTALAAPMGIVVEIGNNQRATIAISGEVPVNVIDGAILLPLIQNTVYYYDVVTNTISTSGTHKIGKSLISRSNSVDGDATFGSIIIDFNSSGGSIVSAIATVADQTARLALSAAVNDIVSQVDTSILYQLRSLPASNNANWEQVSGAIYGPTITESGLTIASDLPVRTGSTDNKVSLQDLSDWYTSPSTGGTSTMRATTTEAVSGVIDNRFVTPVGAAAVVNTIYGPAITESGLTIASTLPVLESGVKRSVTLKDLKDWYAEPSTGGTSTMRATAAETTAGTLDNVFVTPLGLQNKINASGADKNYTQAFVAQTTVVVTHNLAKYPAITVLDVAGNEIIGDILHDSINQATITFNSTVSGTVICN